MDEKNRIINLKRRIVSTTGITAENWDEIGLLTGSKELIDLHPRLIRSLKWNYPDYAANALEVLEGIGDRNPDALDAIEGYLDDHFPEAAQHESGPPADAGGTFFPSVLPGTDVRVEQDLVAIIMPFNKAFGRVNDTLKAACADAGCRALRPDDIWEESTVIREIIHLLHRSAMVVSDFTGKNPNVMYETGFAHAMGKVVIPISQSLDDVPFDVAHHRILAYSTTPSGLFDLQQKIVSKLNRVRA